MTSTRPQADLALEVVDLDVAFKVRGQERQVLRDLSFHIKRGETYGLVGESGCGKSTAALAIVRYLARNGRIRGGAIRIAGRDVVALDAGALTQMRAHEVSMVYQEPGRALNPVLRVGGQLKEAFERSGSSADEAEDHSRAMLAKVQIPDPDRVMRAYPHTLSGGMAQRVVIAMALAASPSLLILDEPTTALDTTVGAEVLDLVAGLREEFETAVLVIAHNLALVANVCDRVGVLYAGALAEEGPTREIFARPRHPYTVGLLRCSPGPLHRKGVHRLETIGGSLPALGADLPGCVYADRCSLADARCRAERPPRVVLGDRSTHCFHHDRAQHAGTGEPGPAPAIASPDRSGAPLLAMRDVSKTFRQDGHDVHALSGVSVELWPGETLGVVGESGSGKTTLARLLLRLTQPDDDAPLELDGSPLPLGQPRGHQLAKSLQIVFQNPDAALNRRHTIRRIVGRGITKLAGLRGAAHEQRLTELTRSVKLSESHLAQRPAALSGGLKQRVGIARAFAGNPRAVVCDEPTSALDVSVQAAILNLLADLQREQRVAYLFISHDLGVVRYLSDRVMVLYLGRVMEIGPAEAVFAGPQHPYTEALLSAVPSIDGPNRRIRLSGDLPSASQPPTGCVFHTRCPRKLGTICETQQPELLDVGSGRQMRCHIPLADLRDAVRADDPQRPDPDRTGATP